MALLDLWLVRHGESTANVAASLAEREQREAIDAESRDADVPLSPGGELQAAALANWLAANTTPTSVWSSPYVRARQTAQIALRLAPSGTVIRYDERLRDRELGVLDLLTSVGVEKRLPAEAVRRRWLGKFYYRPPGGESWTDVALRVRAFLRDLDIPAQNGPALVVAHDAVVMLFLYVCLGLDEQELLEFSQTHVVLNASVTRLSRPDETAPWTLRTFSEVEHLAESEAPITSHPGDKNASIH